jgi:adenylate cyclase class IV
MWLHKDFDHILHKIQIDFQGSTLYHETTCIDAIMTRLRPILKVEEGCSLQSLLESAHLKPFAQLETKRKCYSRDADKVNIVIDATDWGHSVGEIEIMVMDQDHITEATTKIETIGAELGKILITHSVNLSCLNLNCFNIILIY